MIRTMLCDDHAMVREALTEALEHEEEIEMVGAVSTIDDAISLAGSEAIDVAVVDLHLGRDSGLRLVDALREVSPDTRAIILTAFGSPDLVYEAGRLGVFDVIDKELGVADVATHIRSAAAGRRLLDDFTRRAAKDKLVGAGLIAYRELGATDKEILALIARGMTDKQISQRVYLSPQTVRNRISRLLGILGRENRTQLALMVTNLDPFVVPIGAAGSK